MNFDAADDIRRLKDGSIDYQYYSSIGRQTRSREFKEISGKIPGLSMRSVKILPVITVLTILGFMF